MLRSQLLLLACVRKYEPCVRKAEGHFRRWRDSNGTLRSAPPVLLVTLSASQHRLGKKLLLKTYPVSLAFLSCEMVGGSKVHGALEQQ